MIDFRLLTFINLCKFMNYRKTAEALNMTQPAVTQHIHFLENEYNCKLFIYEERKLRQTSQGKELENYVRSIIYNDNNFRQNFNAPKVRQIKIGATKTIGEYIMTEKIANILENHDIELTFLVENTKSLLNKLENFELDIALIEGYFDKTNYSYQLIKTEKLVGICSKNHKFANKTINISETFEQLIILREQGSGTRAVFESLLHEQSFSLENFHSKAIISSFELIKALVKKDLGIAFVYESVIKNDKNLATFNIKNSNPKHEFNYVYLKDTNMRDILKLIKY